MKTIPIEKIALLFPGQGSQFVGMGKTLAGLFPEARQVFETADRIINPPVSKLCFEGPEETLRLTIHAQPAIFTVSMAAYEIIKNQNLDIGCAAGHSVGEYAALSAAGVFSFEEGLRLVKKRGELMYEAGLKRPGGMAAVLGLNAEGLRTICERASRETKQIVEVANLNSPTQVVISGDPEAVKIAGAAALQEGAKRIIPLPVSGAFHSALMEEAAAKLAQVLEAVEFHDPRFPIIANVTAQPASTGPELKSLLKQQIRKSVRWEETIRRIMQEETIRRIMQEDTTAFMELEPGTVLSGLVRSIDKSAKILKLDKFLNPASSRHGFPLARE